MSIRFHRTALVEPAKADEAVAFAAAVSAYATANFGQVTSWGLQMGGTCGTLHWFTDFADMTEFEVTSGRSARRRGLPHHDGQVRGPLRDRIRAGHAHPHGVAGPAGIAGLTALWGDRVANPRVLRG